MNFNPSLPVSYEYIHYTGGTIDTLDLNRTYPQTAEKLAIHTPNGLWLSIAGINDWERYCLKNNYNLINLKYEFQVNLKPAAEILILHNTAALEDFAKKYGYYSGQDSPELSIRWNEIIEDYQGIALPHVFPKMFDMGIWYKIWCYTAACIWDLQAVEKVEKLGN